ncbi:hypothetical protein ANN_05023 [Periplaneta americana]|uniref:Uncharacterized protein n=1 Tax=Periplaneta americana TaxID=6978 RepID=A0ABQ8TCE9_PERAM|nr:hypothetical protein ANN_05023 [Periplaneta americana]
MMMDLCKGDNELPGSLKAICKYENTISTSGPCRANSCPDVLRDMTALFNRRGGDMQQSSSSIRPTGDTLHAIQATDVTDNRLEQ